VFGRRLRTPSSIIAFVRVYAIILISNSILVGCLFPPGPGNDDQAIKRRLRPSVIMVVYARLVVFISL
jgi:hypothetical protein